MQAKSGVAPGAWPIHASPNSACFVCGKENPAGLGLVFHRQEDGGMEAVWSPGSSWEGFQGIIHGGVVSTVLDEAMSKAVSAAGCEALTAELTIRFRQPVPSGGRFRIRGWIVKRNKRLIETEAVVASVDGREHAHAWARFLALSGSGHGPLVRMVAAADDGEHFEVDPYEAPDLPR